jgi:hypothetical protein
VTDTTCLRPPLWWLHLCAGTEISFQDFVTNQLERGRVRKIVVVASMNRAHVYLKDDEQRPSHWFNIGSVDSFERNLHIAQAALDIDPHDFIPVHYEVPNPLTGEFVRFLLSAALFIVPLWFISRSFGSTHLPGSQNAYPQ